MTETPAAAAWASFEEELARWGASGRPATFWWRDDDAGHTHPALERLLALAARYRAPVGIAAVPAWLDTETAACLRAAPAAIAVLQHGFAHANHERVAPAGGTKVRPAECGAARPAGVVLAEIRDGWARLLSGIGARAVPVFVPPWNRIAPDVVAGLPAAGFRALSAFGARATPVPGLRRLDCHADPILWRDGKRFAGTAVTLERLQAHLADRRVGRADPDEPTGLLTHHRDLDPAFWAFLEEWLDRLIAHPAAVFPPLPPLLGGPDADAQSI
jgi:hypothetical protein